MADPLSIAALGGVAAGAAVKFLFDQAGVLLTRWRERRDKRAESRTEPVEVRGTELLQGELKQPVIHHDVLNRVEPELRAARRALADIADGTDPVDPDDQRTMAQIDALRRLVEAVLQQRITFRGESREPTGPVVEGTVVADEVMKLAAAVRAGSIVAGKVIGTVDVKKATGEVYGVVVDTVGVPKDDDANGS